MQKRERQKPTPHKQFLTLSKAAKKGSSKRKLTREGESFAKKENADIHYSTVVLQRMEI